MNDQSDGKKIPILLKKEPLIEAVWEIRFKKTNPSIAELLPGLIFKEMHQRYPGISRLPAADIPSAIIDRDSSLRYVPKIRLDGGTRAIQIGEYVLGLSCRRPYPGWDAFSADIRALVNLVQETGLITSLERFSLKFVNLIETNQPPKLDSLNVELRVGDKANDESPVLIRTEMRTKEFVHIIQIVSPAEVVLPDEQSSRSGVLLDIDTIAFLQGDNSWLEMNNLLDEGHLAAKNIFFELLSRDTINKMEPVYEG